MILQSSLKQLVGKTDVFSGDAMNTFFSERSFFYIVEGYEMSGIASSAPFEIGLLPPPMGPDAEDYMSCATICVAYNFVNNGKSMDESGAVFVAYNKRMGNYYPDFDSSYEELSWREQLEVYFDYSTDDMEMVDLILDSISFDHMFKLPNPRATFFDAYSSIFFGNATPKEAFDGVAGPVNAALDEANNY
jgi:hypothetical protein